jgi:hypothetical protein
MRYKLMAEIMCCFMVILLSMTARDAHAQVITVLCDTVEHSAMGNPDTHHKWELMFDLSREIVWQTEDGWKPATITGNKISWGDESLDRTTLTYFVDSVPQNDTTCRITTKKLQNINSK